MIPGDGVRATLHKTNRKKKQAEEDGWLRKTAVRKNENSTNNMPRSREHHDGVGSKTAQDKSQSTLRHRSAGRSRTAQCRLQLALR